jgi:hypothetical protein
MYWVNRTTRSVEIAKILDILLPKKHNTAICTKFLRKILKIFIESVKKERICRLLIVKKQQLTIGSIINDGKIIEKFMMMKQKVFSGIKALFQIFSSQIQNT